MNSIMKSGHSTRMERKIEKWERELGEGGEWKFKKRLSDTTLDTHSVRNPVTKPVLSKI